MVYVFFAHGFEEIEALTVVDLLRRADIQTKTVSIMEEKLVYGAHGIGVQCDILLKEAEFRTCAMVVFPGGMPGTTNLCNHKDLIEEVQKFYDAGKPVAAICAAPMVLAKAGLFDGHEATIYPGMEDELTGARPVSGNVVKSGQLITSKGPGTAMEFALSLIAELKGQETAEEIQKQLVYRGE